jgi:MraZ protein
MLIGEYIHTIDDKRRMSLPAKFRKALGKKVVITHGLDSCLFVFSLAQWEKILEKLETLSMGQSDSRAFNRFLLAGAQDVEIDSLGRILLPEYLASFATLQGKAVLIGVHDRIELWNEKNWKTYKARIEKQADTLAQKLGELGVL